MINISVGNPRGGKQGNGDIVTEERALPPFSGIALKSVGSVRVIWSDEYRIKVTVDSNLQEDVLTEVRDKTLYCDIRPTEGSINYENLSFEVYLPELRRVTITGVSAVECEEGHGTSLTVNTSGVGSFNGRDYQVNEAVVCLSGVGSATVWVAERLSINLSGVGSVYYRGDPPEREITVSGLGQVHEAD